MSSESWVEVPRCHGGILRDTSHYWNGREEVSIGVPMQWPLRVRVSGRMSETPLKGCCGAIGVSVSVGELGSPACSTGAVTLNMLSQDICRMSGQSLNRWGYWGICEDHDF